MEITRIIIFEYMHLARKWLSRIIRVSRLRYQSKESVVTGANTWISDHDPRRIIDWTKSRKSKRDTEGKERDRELPYGSGGDYKASFCMNRGKGTLLGTKELYRGTEKRDKDKRSNGWWKKRKVGGGPLDLWFNSVISIVVCGISDF